MSSVSVTTVHRAARNQATITLADTGAAASQLEFYDAEGGTLLAVRRLAKPCGIINAAGRIALQPASTNDIVASTGTPTFALWRNGNGDVISGGAVTNEAGAGPFKLAGTETMIIYEGGLLLLASPALLG